MINKVTANDEGNWSCRMKFEDKRGKTKTQKKSINLALEEEYYDDDEYYYDEHHHYDHHNTYKHHHYHYKTSTTTTTTTTTPQCPTSEWKEFQNHCYIIIRDHGSMQSCREECKRKGGGDLASIHSTEENNFVADLIRQRLKSSEYLTRQRWYWCWIGATLNEFTKEFTWLDGTPWDFTNWRPGGRSCQKLLKR